MTSLPNYEKSPDWLYSSPLPYEEFWRRGRNIFCSIPHTPTNFRTGCRLGKSSFLSVTQKRQTAKFFALLPCHNNPAFCGIWVIPCPWRVTSAPCFNLVPPVSTEGRLPMVHSHWTELKTQRWARQTDAFSFLPLLTCPDAVSLETSHMDKCGARSCISSKPVLELDQPGTVSPSRSSTPPLPHFHVPSLPARDLHVPHQAPALQTDRRTDSK